MNQLLLALQWKIKMQEEQNGLDSEKQICSDTYPVRV